MVVTMVTYRHRVDEEDDECDEEEQADTTNEVPLVLLPDDVLEGLPRGGEPQERCLGAAGIERGTL